MAMIVLSDALKLFVSEGKVGVATYIDHECRLMQFQDSKTQLSSINSLTIPQPSKSYIAEQLYATHWYTSSYLHPSAGN